MNSKRDWGGFLVGSYDWDDRNFSYYAKTLPILLVQLTTIGLKWRLLAGQDSKQPL